MTYTRSENRMEKNETDNHLIFLRSDRFFKFILKLFLSVMI